MAFQAFQEMQKKPSDRLEYSQRSFSMCRIPFYLSIPKKQGHRKKAAEKAVLAAFFLSFHVYPRQNLLIKSKQTKKPSGEKKNLENTFLVCEKYGCEISHSKERLFSLQEINRQKLRQSFTFKERPRVLCRS